MKIIKQIIGIIKALTSAFKAVPLSTIKDKFKAAKEAKNAKDWAGFGSYLVGGATLIWLLISKIIESLG